MSDKKQAASKRSKTAAALPTPDLSRSAQTTVCPAGGQILSQHILQKMLEKSASMTNSSVSNVIQTELTRLDSLNIFWATHIKPGANALFSIFGQNVKPDYLRACSQVRAGATGTEHWLSVETVDMTLGMFQTAIKAIKVHEHEISFRPFTIHSGDNILLCPCTICYKITVSPHENPYRGRGMRIKQKLAKSSRIWCPVYVRNCHFILLDFDHRQRNCSIRDSQNEDNQVEKATHELASRFTEMIDRLCGTDTKTASPWTFDAPIDVVQQANQSDCGLHVLSWIAGKILGIETPDVTRLRQLLPVLLLAFWSHSCPDLFQKSLMLIPMFLETLVASSQKSR